MAGLNHGWDELDNSRHADFIHGGVDPDDFSDAMVRHKKRANRGSRTKGCPANDGSAHVYVWVPTWTQYYDNKPYFKDSWANRYYKQSEVAVCAGCGKRKSINSFRRIDED